jgi:hypothetical protein
MLHDHIRWPKPDRAPRNPVMCTDKGVFVRYQQIFRKNTRSIVVGRFYEPAECECSDNFLINVITIKLSNKTLHWIHESGEFSSFRAMILVTRNS